MRAAGDMRHEHTQTHATIRDVRACRAATADDTRGGAAGHGDTRIAECDDDNQLNDIDSRMPFFLYYVPGGTHAPHHPTPEWIKKISDMHLFDKGWNALRDQIFANQKRLGVIPQDAKLTPWPND